MKGAEMTISNDSSWHYVKAALNELDRKIERAGISENALTTIFATRTGITIFVGEAEVRHAHQTQKADK